MSAIEPAKGVANVQARSDDTHWNALSIDPENGLWELQSDAGESTHSLAANAWRDLDSNCGRTSSQPLNGENKSWL